jgi:cystathionine beta-lyase/cystathionine gamma-synthase
MNLDTGYDYSRVQNPTREVLEHTLSGLEHAADTIAFASGMAAATALMELFSPGDHIIAADDLYGGTHRLFSSISKKNGLKFSYAIDTADIAELIRPETKCIFVESPTNPLMNVFDIQAIAKETAGKDILLVVDNTFLTPYFQNPILLGADIVLHSGSKYLSGHNDTLAGFLAVKDTAVSDRLRQIYKTTGGILAPFDSFLVIRGIKTLAVRMKKQAETAGLIAAFLSSHSGVEEVYYPGIKDHPDYALSCRQARGHGAMISFIVQDKTAIRHVLEDVRVIQYAESLGGVESLITYPILQTHADAPDEERLSTGISDKLIRLSVGLESADDLIEDLKQALAR